MRISTFFFLTRRGLRNLGKHWAMTIACIASLSVCMTLNSFASLAEVNVDSMVSYLAARTRPWCTWTLTATTPPPPRWEKSSLPCRGSVGCSMCPNRTC